MKKSEKAKEMDFRIGDLVLNKSTKVLTQSMTSTPTMDTEATVAQCVRIIEAGADLFV